MSGVQTRGQTAKMDTEGTEDDTAQLYPKRTFRKKKNKPLDEDEKLYGNEVAYQDRIARKTAIAKTLLSKLQNGANKDMAAISLARSIARGRSRQVQLQPLDLEDFKRIIFAQDPGFENLEDDFLLTLSYFFKTNPQYPKELIFRKIPKTDEQTRKNPLYRSALRIAKLINARDRYDKINFRNLSSQYIEKRSKVSNAAKVGSLNFMLNKQMNWYKKYGQTDPAIVRQDMLSGLTKGLSSTLARVTKMFDTGVENLAGFSNTQYEKFKKVQAENKIEGVASEDVETVLKSLI